MLFPCTTSVYLPAFNVSSAKVQPWMKLFGEQHSLSAFSFPSLGAACQLRSLPLAVSDLLSWLPGWPWTCFISGVGTVAADPLATPGHCPSPAPLAWLGCSGSVPWLMRAQSCRPPYQPQLLLLALAECLLTDDIQDLSISFSTPELTSASGFISAVFRF